MRTHVECLLIIPVHPMHKNRIHSKELSNIYRRQNSLMHHALDKVVLRAQLPRPLYLHSEAFFFLQRRLISDLLSIFHLNEDAKKLSLEDTSRRWSKYRARSHDWGL